MMRIAGKQLPAWLIIVDVLALLAICAWPFIAYISIFAFDDPSAAHLRSTYTYVGIALLYPVVPVAGVLASFLAYRGQRKRLAYGLAAISLLPAAIIVVLLIALQVMNMLMFMGAKLQTSVP